jgi:hypothetical protein
MRAQQSDERWRTGYRPDLTFPRCLSLAQVSDPAAMTSGQPSKTTHLQKTPAT